ncbi:MAG: protein-tyrosine-phosphatase family, putative arsenate reductase, partial [Dehalococcoidia bacterium]|nr:protein-tyrosine-phosphatase family, putative arsenate reductase [Dehalococcoidia bacterium]
SGKANAISAGTKPATRVDPVVIEAMREVGIDISNNLPKALTPEMAEQADRIVTMGCGVEGVCPATFVETEDWGLEDPKGKPLEKVREIRNEVRNRILKMLEDGV